MVDLFKIKGFEWDGGNVEKNTNKHNVLPFEAQSVFFNQPLLISNDDKHSQFEARYNALGKTGAYRLLHITFTLRNSNTLIRVISVRDMHIKERSIYEQAKKENT